MSEKKRSKIICRNLSCRAFLCESDGEFLYLENLEILPKIGRRKQGGWQPLTCHGCGAIVRIYLTRKQSEPEKTVGEKNRKFSIFRSRF